MSEQHSLRNRIGKAWYCQADIGKVERLDDRVPISAHSCELTAFSAEDWYEPYDLVSGLGREVVP